jgi:hypothetical protein
MAVVATLSVAPAELAGDAVVMVIGLAGHDAQRRANHRAHAWGCLFCRRAKRPVHLVRSACGGVVGDGLVVMEPGDPCVRGCEIAKVAGGVGAVKRSTVELLSGPG